MRLGSASAASRSALPLPLGEGWGGGLPSLFTTAPPHPICGVYHRAALLRRPVGKSTSPHRGEVNRMRGWIDSIRIHRALAAQVRQTAALLATSFGQTVTMSLPRHCTISGTESTFNPFESNCTAPPVMPLIQPPVNLAPRNAAATSSAFADFTF